MHTRSRKKREGVPVTGKILVGDGFEKGDMTLFDPSSRKVVKRWSESGGVFRIKCFRVSGLQCAAFSRGDGKVCVRIFPRKKSSHGFKFSGHTKATQGLDYISLHSGKTSLLTSCAMDGQTRIWDIKSRRCLHTFRPRSISKVARHVQFVDGDSLLTSFHNDHLVQYDLNKLCVTRTRKTDYFWHFCLHHQKNILVGAGYGNDNHPFSEGEGSKRVSCHDLKTLREKPFSSILLDKPLYSSAVLSNGDILIGTNCDMDNTVYTLDPRMMNRIKEERSIFSRLSEIDQDTDYPEGGVKSIVDLPKKEKFAICCKNRIVQIHPYDKKQKTYNFKLRHQTYGMDFFPEKRKGVGQLGLGFRLKDELGCVFKFNIGVEKFVEVPQVRKCPYCQHECMKDEASCKHTRCGRCQYWFCHVCLRPPKMKRNDKKHFPDEEWNCGGFSSLCDPKRTDCCDKNGVFRVQTIFNKKYWKLE